MRFKTGFLVGCAAGAWAASKASQLKQGDGTRADWPRVATSRAEHVNAEATAERVRVISDLARERFNDFLTTPLGAMARDRLAEAVGSSLGRGNGRETADQDQSPST
jgi:hypothetical protein